MEGQQKAVTERIVNTVENEDLSLYLGQAEEMLQKYSATDLVAAVLKSLTKEPDETPIKLTDEAPLPMRRSRSGSASGSNNRQRNGRSSVGGRKDFGGKRPSNRKSNSHGNRNSSQKREKQNY